MKNNKIIDEVIENKINNDFYYVMKQIDKLKRLDEPIRIEIGNISDYEKELMNLKSSDLEYGLGAKFDNRDDYTFENTYSSRDLNF